MCLVPGFTTCTCYICQFEINDPNRSPGDLGKHKILLCPRSNLVIGPYRFLSVVYHFIYIKDMNLRGI